MLFLFTSKMLMSFTYTIRKSFKECIKTELSKLNTLYHFDIKKFLNRKYHSFKNCFNSYNAFNNLRTLPFFFEKSLNDLIYTISSISLYKKAILTFI